MDSITQAALGGVVGELVLGRKIGWKGMAWGMVFGTLPDLDILFYPWLDQASQLRWHRGISHSILMMVVVSFAFAWPLARIHGGKGVTVKRAGWFVFLAWSTHVLIDVFTTYGTQVFEPFSDQRVAFNNLFIVDPLFTLPLLGCVLARPWKGFRYFWQRRRWVREGSEPEDEPEFPKSAVPAAKLALGLSGLYVAFSFVMKIWATDQMKGHLLDEIPDGRVISVAPTPFNTLLWRGLVETNEAYWVTYWSPFDREGASYDFIPKHREIAARYEGEEVFETLKWFSRGHWIARKAPKGETVFVDVRFGELRNLEHRQLMPMFQWRLGYDPDGKFQADSYRPRDLDVAGALGLIWERIWGEKERWESMKSF